MKKRKDMLTVVLLFSFLALLESCYQEMQSKSHTAFNTFCSVSGSVSSDFEKIFEELDFLEKELDSMKSDSLLNQKLTEFPTEIFFDGEVASLFYESVQLTRWLDGAFDITVAPLVHLWKIGNGATSPPRRQAIDEALSRVGLDKTFIEGNALQIRWKRERGTSIDFGAIAKGYAADRIIENYFYRRKRDYLLLNLGGNISAFGEHPEGRAWRIGIQDPYSQRGECRILVEIQNQSASTSGIYERFFEFEGKRYHHLLDPKRGIPVENELASVTVITRSAMIADACSTGFFVLGQEKAIQKINEFNEKKCFGAEKMAVLFIHREGAVVASSNLKGKLFFSDEEESSREEVFFF